MFYFSEFTYEVINRTVSNNRNLKVVHFDDAFQFVPTGKCPWVIIYCSLFITAE